MNIAEKARCGTPQRAFFESYPSGLYPFVKIQCLKAPLQLGMEICLCQIRQLGQPFPAYRKGEAEYRFVIAR